MNDLDLFSLRDEFNRNRIMLCFNGPMSHALIEEIGNALRGYLAADRERPSAAMDVFGVYIELTQNIRHYSAARGYADLEAVATVVVARSDEGHYVVHAGNVVEQADGEALLGRVSDLAGMDKSELKAAYKSQLRQPRDESAASGAGLGLIDVARKSSSPLVATLTPMDDGRAYLSVRAII